MNLLSQSVHSSLWFFHLWRL